MLLIISLQNVTLFLYFSLSSLKLTSQSFFVNFSSIFTSLKENACLLFISNIIHLVFGSFEVFTANFSLISFFSQ